MSCLQIVEYPANVLRERAAEVVNFDASLQHLITNLTDTLYGTSGIGLSAPQIGESARVLIADLTEDRTDCKVYINPQILKKAGMAFVLESCLSLPGISANIMRSAQVLIKAQDADGHEFEQELEGMHAVCLQHELDHLDGKLFIDHVSRLRALRFRKTLKALEQRASINNATASAYSPS